MTPTLTTADRLSQIELLDIWNRGFSGYFVDNTMDETRLAKHIRWSGVDLARSAVLLVDEKPAAFSLAAIQERGGGLAAWIAGFGVAPEHRRKGLAGRLMQEHCEILDEAGVAETLLEVIEENPARRVYSAAGFREGRRLVSFQGLARLEEAPSCRQIDPKKLSELHSALHPITPPVWRRDLPVLGRMLEGGPPAETWAAPAFGSVAAFALVVPGQERVSILDAAAVDATAGRQLVAGLAEAFEGKPMRVIDEPAGGPMAKALEAAGLDRFLTQFEMVRVAPLRAMQGLKPIE